VVVEHSPLHPKTRGFRMNVVAPTNEPFLLSVTMLNVVMLNVVAPFQQFDNFVKKMSTQNDTLVS
jgi:hypothetical protein